MGGGGCERVRGFRVLSPHFRGLGFRVAEFGDLGSTACRF